MSSSEYHIPVLLDASVEALNINPNGVYVDATFGGGGHSRAILARLEGGHLYGFDQDPDAAQNTLNDPRFTLIDQNFRYMQNFLRMHAVTAVDGVLADLGVSSHQFDEADRGFSLRHDAPLDMRMNPTLGRTAADLLAHWTEDELAAVLKQYGEVPGAHRLARAICKQRDEKPIATTGDLFALAGRMVAPPKQAKYAAQVFQAIRIAVNDELDALRQFLEQCKTLLKPGGRLVVIAYHSLEDRMVKHYLRAGNFSGEVEKDFYGNPLTPFVPISRSAIAPSDAEIKLNSRARSARLRVAERRP